MPSSHNAMSNQPAVVRFAVFALAALSTFLMAGAIAGTALAAQHSSSSSSQGVQLTAGGSCQPWSLVGVPNPRTHHYLRDIDDLASNDIWAVGEYYDDNNYTPDTALAMHWDGVQWTIFPTPPISSGRPSLNGVSVLAPNDVWAVGYCGGCAFSPLAMHWNGVQWVRVVTPDPPGYIQLNDVVALAPDNVWAVGANDGSHSTIAMNWDGNAWTIVPTPNGGKFSDDNVLTSITAVSPEDMWAVGYIYPKGGTPSPISMHWNGSQWSMVNTPDPGNYSTRLDAVEALSSNDVWAVGSYSDNLGETYIPLFLHWNGTQWQHVASPEFGDYNSLRDVHAISPSDIWAVGTTAACNFCSFETLTMHWDGAAWSVAPSPNGFRGFSRLEGVTATASGDVWAVGFTDQYAYPYTSDSLVLRKSCIVNTPTPSPTGATRTATSVPTSTPGGPPYCTVPSFGTHTQYSVGDGPERSVTADFNEDGHLDLAVVNKNSTNMSVLLGNGNGGFGPAATYALRAQPEGITVGDYNRDGHLDLVASGYGVYMAQILLGDGAGGFGPVSTYGSGSGSAGIATADFNRDGNPDLVIADDGHDSMLVLINNGSGGFGAGTRYDLDWIPTDIAVGDFNGDGNIDVAAPNSFSDNVSVRLGNGSGGFGSLQNYDVAPNPRSITTGDYNRDGNLDFATSSGDTGNISVRLGNGTGGFGALSYYPAGNGSMSIGQGDFNGDGILDLAVANVPGNVAVLLGNDAGGFGALTNFRVGSGPVAVTAGDFNGDTKLDLAVTNNTGDSMSVLLNTCPAFGPTPTNTPQVIATVTPTVTTAQPSATRTATQVGSTATVTTATPTSAVGTATASNVTATLTSLPGTTATPGTCSLTFSDVPSAHTFYPYVMCLACRGIVGGYSDGTFRPNNEITRGQIAKIVSNAAGFNEPPGGQIYEDVPETNAFFTWVNRLSNHGVMGGYACGGVGEPCRAGNRPYFRPSANATRGQIAKIVSNAAGFVDEVGTQTFEDVGPSHAFYQWIGRLAMRGVMGGYQCGGPGEPCGQGSRPYFRPFNNATRGQTSKIVSNTFFPACNP